MNESFVLTTYVHEMLLHSTVTS